MTAQRAQLDLGLSSGYVYGFYGLNIDEVSDVLHEIELSFDNYHSATCVQCLCSLHTEEGQPKVKLRSKYLMFDKIKSPQGSLCPIQNSVLF
jgi:hypothetical protein